MCTRHLLHVFFCSTACTRRLEDHTIYCCTRNLVGTSLLNFTLYATAPRYYSILLCTRYKPAILACSSNAPCFTANRERRRAAGQLTAQENARYKDSYLRTFDPARPLHLESWIQWDMQKGFTDELQRLRPGRCQFCGDRSFATRTPTQAGAVAEGQYTCDRCKRDKKPVKSLSSANGMDPGSVPDQLKGLTQAEEMLITKGCPVMRVYRLKGGQRG